MKIWIFYGILVFRPGEIFKIFWRFVSYWSFVIVELFQFLLLNKYPDLVPNDDDKVLLFVDFLVTFQAIIREKTR